MSRFHELPPVARNQETQPSQAELEAVRKICTTREASVKLWAAMIEDLRDKVPNDPAFADDYCKKLLENLDQWFILAKGLAHLDDDRYFRLAFPQYEEPGRS